MTIERHETAARMSKIVIHNHTAYLCGQVAEDRSANISQQTRTMLDKVSDLLFSVGSSPEKILSATIYLKDMALFSEMNAVWDSWVPEGHAPARACVEAAMASPELLVEISVIAATD
ncbi:Enamine deaminase RidA, house cleaning of reactive enamine intermediates, YjgF/YER057c/UK114 family [Amphritea atlantica]|uniref:Enamine deaminase RidA, house cleaning of reactive enamine intermediates, YjgF/YER057c/UK114 family n=1 Tax=Amphritea atlantica TaxID=355243 RepID=A0A1H9GTN9_9GAMM|nr:RidA family protein [Amphritea atlantica]SEQ53442.1 Enamine deaminase RidA, house cleaning of reactive enamine intermediates, YjgF/YER057c/UK114 family [Amphritea atlantica]